MKSNKNIYVTLFMFIAIFSLCMAGLAYSMAVADKRNKQLVANEETIKTLESDVENWSMGYANLETQVVTLKEQVDTLTAENDKLKSEVDKYALENVELKQKLADQEEVIEQSALNEEIKACKPNNRHNAKSAKSSQETTKTTSTNAFNLSEDEIYMLAQLIYLEGGSTSYKCQLAIGSVTLNLMKADGVSLKTEIYTPGRFSVAKRVARTTPSETSLRAARQLATNGTTLPSNVKCFRNKHYFSWCTPYCCIDGVYFGSY